jgi:hypothetical protein
MVFYGLFGEHNDSKEICGTTKNNNKSIVHGKTDKAWCMIQGVEKTPFMINLATRLVVKTAQL